MGDRLATIDVCQKVERGCCAPFCEGDGSPSNTAGSPGPTPTQLKLNSILLTKR